MSDNQLADHCQNPAIYLDRHREKLHKVVNQLTKTCLSGECFEHLAPQPIPLRDDTIKIIKQARKILFPGYFTQTRIDPINLKYYLGQELSELHEMLGNQIILAIRHDCLRYHDSCVNCEERGLDAASDFVKQLPELRGILATDVRAAIEGDPAAKSVDQVIFSYPGLFAISIYRMAHQLHHLDVPLLPRMMTEYAHNLTGIDINPGAHIDESFFIDHGTGIVVGETTRIGKRVRIYQGVTLGALSLPRDAGESLRNTKRHPTIEDEVIIYAGATILGGDTIIGARSVIGGNVWLTSSVPADTKVLQKPQQPAYSGESTRKNEAT
ncbi:MAG: serine acetyltransferase [Pseudomonadota bacterium]|nr:serine acetyltransferase [Pseudomonadota bacterium]